MTPTKNRNSGTTPEKIGELTLFARENIAADGVTYQRKAIQTHFIERKEDYVGLIRRYVLPVWQKGDFIISSEKVAAMCQDDTVQMSDVKVGFWAKFLSKFASSNCHGIGMDEPYKLQLAIDLKGLPRILFASVCSGIGKIFKKKGVFYKIAGQDVAGIDGFYKHSSFEVYHTMAVLMPSNPEALCAKVEEETGVPMVLVDANDLSQEIIAVSPSLAEVKEQTLLTLIADNPAGQDDELTPFVLYRPLTEGSTS